MNPELQKLNDKIEAFEKKFEHSISQYEGTIALDGVLLDEALKNQVELQVEYERLHGEAVGLENDASTLKELFHSAAFAKEMKSKAKRPDTFTEAKMYANTDDDFVMASMTYNRIFKVKAEVHGVLEAVITRKFVLNNLTNAVINSVNKHIL